jgi:hypothetical protein
VSAKTPAIQRRREKEATLCAYSAGGAAIVVPVRPPAKRASGRALCGYFSGAPPRCHR